MLKKITKLFLTLVSCVYFATGSAQAQTTSEYIDYTQYRPVEGLDLRYSDRHTNREYSYLYYTQYVDDIPVASARYTLIVDNMDSQIKRRYDNTVKNTYHERFPEITSLSTPFIDSLQSISIYHHVAPVWYGDEYGLVPCLRYDFDLPSGSISGLWSLDRAQWITFGANNNNFSDSTISTKLFHPDPITRAHSIYGLPIRDYQDSSYTTLMNEATWLKFHCYYESDSGGFITQNRWAKMVDIEPPTIAVNYVVQDSFEVNRTNPIFEDFMVLAHIDLLQDWIGRLGVNALQNYQLHIDAHGHYGQDNSSFRAYTGPQPDEIAFGIGGVDDAEDADVITHEYTHSLIHAPHGILSSQCTQESLSVQEGLADFIATVYSYSIDPWGWYRIYSWDGHNEFWDGRLANTTNNYVPAEANIYKKGEVLNSALSKVAIDRDIDSVSKLVLESFFLLNENTSVPQYANIILDLDDLYHGEALSADLCKSFRERGILLNCDTTVAIEYAEVQPFEVLNTSSFSQGVADMKIVFDQKLDHIEYRIVNSLGQEIRSEKLVQRDQIEISPKGLSGVYYLYLTDHHNAWTIPLHVY